ncbi:MAG TPA: YkgJ family cysteine cluster protein [Thermoanaerobaculia bacterium]|nr:YkgJ family cysteine cluster protein [Thermoanaerobaculia bacterium]
MTAQCKLHEFSMATNNGNVPRKPLYDCTKCPAYCCSYERIVIEPRDLRRLAKHFDVDLETARRRFTKMRDGEQVLRHQKDKIYGSVCMFLDTKARRCTIYEARPEVCHEYPDQPRCGYWEFLKWERGHQDDEEFIPMYS